MEGRRFRLPRIAARTIFLSGRIEGSLEENGPTSVVVWDYRHHLVEYLVVVFLGGAVTLGIVLGIAGLWLAPSQAPVVLAYTLFNGLMLAVVVELISDERSKLRGDLEKTLARVGRWSVLPHARGSKP